ncbi:protein jagged-1b isoform X2 [Gouania willdenowi]|uniref:protein jagged-1b isoform X2 n=1 Tax=Gouania willdenowi TaxID=441366 RepID=UPI001054A17D|nr:protein jagged-1b-like isoform X2 [Gouania willdenowi]
MESPGMHGMTRLSPTNSCVKMDSAPGVSAGTHRGNLLLLQRVVIFLLTLSIQQQVVCAVGMFELQIRHFQNPHGLLQNGDCCDLQVGSGPRCSSMDQCDTFFKACLKEYQARVVATGTCTFGSGSTGILGGNSQSLHHHGHDGGGEEGTNGHIVIPFKYAWPKSFSLVLEALDFDNDTSESGQLIERVLLSSMLNPGDQWQMYRHHGRTFSLEYRLRFRCDFNYYGPFCNKFCRARDEFFGHFNCDSSGYKICMDGWTGPECIEAVCRQGCHHVHGSCTVPGECKCQYGWTGPLCDQCVTFPGCVYGSCTKPWQCVCDINWGGLLCDKDLNYCGTHQPCRNGGTCINTEPNEYQCECQEGYRGRNCNIVVRQCDRSPCGRGATCQEAAGGFRCLCPPGWTGRTCQLDTNECEMNICDHARSCRNLIGGYLCDCLPGWTGTNCDIRNSSCQGLCLNGGRCEDLPSDSKCVCPPGFSGKYCQTILSLCESTPCLHGGHCVEEDGRNVTCNCLPGYSGFFCENIPLDPCSPNPCLQGEQCHSTEGRYMCGCPDGYYGDKCISLRNPCIGPHCPGSMSNTSTGSISFYMILVGILAFLTLCGCVTCILVLSHFHRKRIKQPTVPQEEGINNQREYVNLIRNVDPAMPPPPPVSPVTSHPASSPGSHCYEEIELTLPPSLPPPHPSPALKPAHPPKIDISNREREKLNRFHQTDNQDLEV